MTETSDLAYLMATGRRRNKYDAKRQFATRLMQQGMDASPVQHPLQGASRLAQALVGGWMGSRVDAEEKEAGEKYSTGLAKVMAEKDPQKRIALASEIDPQLGLRLTGQMAVEQAKIDRQNEGLQQAGAAFGGSYGMPPQGAQPQIAAQPQQGGGSPRDPLEVIASIESPGQPNGGYGAIGPPADAKGSRAHGKYQIMDFNVGPWTKEILGQEMTPDQFRANPKAQDIVAKTKWAQFRQQFGSDEAASRVWFAGPGGMNNPNARDVNGTTVAGYSQKFQAGMGQGAPPQSAAPPPPSAAPVIAQGATDAVPGMPPQPSAQSVTGPALVAPPDVPRPPPDPEVVRRAQQLMTLPPQQGGITMAQATNMVEEDRNNRWQVQRERAKTVDARAFEQGQKEDERSLKQRGQLAGERERLEGINSKLDRMATEATRILSHPGLGWATGTMAGVPGIGGTLTIPGTDAADFKAALDALKSQIGFSVLQEMRETSKTGGALGAVSDRELTMLQANLASLDTAQSVESFKAALQRIIEYTQETKGRFATAFNAKAANAGAAPAAAAQPGAPPPAGGGLTMDAIDAEIARRKGGR